MTRGIRNLNTRILKGFLSDVTEGIFGEIQIHPRLIPAFFDKARDTDLLVLGKYMDSFTSDLESNPDLMKRKGLLTFVESIVNS